MSKISDVITALCPEGVPFRRLGDIGSFYGGLTGKSKDDFKDGNAVFITYKNVYSNIELNTIIEDRVRVGENEKQNTVQYGDVLFTGSSETPDECGISSVLTTHTEKKLYLNSFCFGYRFSDPDMFLPEFTKHLFRSRYLRYQITRTASGVTRFNVSKKKMEDVIIPVPSKEIQREIARVLDNFTELTAGLTDELTAELTARKQQYEYYRNKMLTFDKGIKVIPLEKIAEIATGSSNTNEGLEEGKYPFFVRSQDPLRKNEYEFDETAIITAGDGVGVGKVYHYVEGKYALHQRAYRIHIISPEVLPRYYFHYMRSAFLPYIEKTMYQGSVASIRRPMLNAFPVPIPALDIQKRIVNVLDHYEAKYSDLNICLSAEISARQKQYEYYRDKLLTFKRIK